MKQRVPFEKLGNGFGTTRPLKRADRQWCLEEAIDITKEAASGGAQDLPALLDALYAKLKELGEDAWHLRARTSDEDGEAEA